MLQNELFDSKVAPTKPETDDKTSSRSGTFTDNMRLPVHRWFRYSAGFSADWVRQVIREYDGPHSPVVLDPFAGSGTTLLAAEAEGCDAFGYEPHPFVYRVAKAKLGWNVVASELVLAARNLLDDAASRVGKLPPDVPPLLEKCFQPDSLAKLFALRDSFLSASYDEPVANLLWLAISAILRPSSHVGTAQWQYVLPNKKKAKTAEPFEAFLLKIYEIASDIDFVEQSGYSDSAKVFLSDAREKAPIEKDSIDLVVTSPPYPNNYDYADATRLEMTFWGEIASWGDLHGAVRKYILRSCSQHAAADKLVLVELLSDEVVEPIRPELSQVCNELAEVRLTKGGRKAYHTMVAAYFVDLAKVFLSLRSVCKQKSKLCFVVGDSAPYGVYVPADKWLGELAIAAGFKSYEFEKIRDRNIKWKNRKHRVPLHEGRLWIGG